jgi:CheY-like chemotaxis protein
MAHSGSKGFKAVIIDDNQVLRMQLRDLLHRLYPQIEVHTADNGVEGLGLVYVIKPDLVFVDTTLPRYGGMEVIEYLTTNVDLKQGLTKVLVLSETTDMNVDPSKYALIDKRSPQFVELIQEACRIFLPVDPVTPKTRVARLVNLLAGTAIVWANRADLAMRSLSKHSGFSPFRLPLWLWWTATQLMAAASFLFYGLCSRRFPDHNIDQQRKDLLYYRTRYYPSLVGALATFLFLILQVGLFIGGGIVIFSNIKVNSVFANYATSVDVNFQSAEYDPRFITHTANGYALGEFDPSTEANPGSLPTTINTEPNATQAVLGATTSRQLYTTHPVITFTQGVDFSRLFTFREQSNLTAFSNSQAFVDPSRPLPELVAEQGSLITYQLSPDMGRWYYLNPETKWQLTDANWSSSNTVQQLNLGINAYHAQVGGDTVYVRAYLHSDGTQPVILQRLQWERELQFVSIFNQASLPVFTPAQEPRVSVSDIQAGSELPSPLVVSFISRAESSSVWGLVPGLQIRPEETNLFSVEILSPNGNLQTAVMLNTAGEAYFEFPHIPSFLQTAAVRALFSNAEGAVQSSTVWEQAPGYVVTTTNDKPDTLIDGWCRTVDNSCSLRAAIAEANNLDADVATQITFALSTNDSGYRDYDLVSAAHSGDGVDDDDLWLFEPQTPLPPISASIVIAGPKSVSGDHPVIEISGAGKIGSLLDIASGSEVGVDNVALTGYVEAGVNVSGRIGNLELNSNVIGLDTFGLSKRTPATQAYGLVIEPDAEVSNLTLQKNRLAGNADAQIRIGGVVGRFSLLNSILGLSEDNSPILTSGDGLVVTTTGKVSASNISDSTFAGFGYTRLAYAVRWDSELIASEWCNNRFGLVTSAENRAVSGPEAVGLAIFDGAQDSTIGGQGCPNYFVGHKFGLQISPGGHALRNFSIADNVFGTDPAQLTQLPNQIALFLNGSTSWHPNTRIANNSFSFNGYAQVDQANALNGALVIVEGARGIEVTGNSFIENSTAITLHNANSGELPPGDAASNQAQITANKFTANLLALKLIGSSSVIAQNSFTDNVLDLQLNSYTDGIRKWLSAPNIDNLDLISEINQ